MEEIYDPTVPSKYPSEPPKTLKPKRTKRFRPDGPPKPIEKKKASEFRREYEAQLFELHDFERFPLDQPGGTPLLIFTAKRPKFVFVLGLGRETKLTNDAIKGIYEQTEMIQCQAELDDPPDDKTEAIETLINLAMRVDKLRMDENVENIGVVCYAGQNRSVSTLLLFMMVYVYSQMDHESTGDFAFRLLTILTSVRPGAFVSLDEVRWYGMKEQKSGFSWFELVIEAYDVHVSRSNNLNASFEKLVFF